MDYKQYTKEQKKRRQDILEIYEAGVGVTVIARELGITRPRVYQILKKAKSEKEAELVQAETLEATSEYVRRSASREYNKAAYGAASEVCDELAECVTCRIVKPWKELQAGHFIPRAQGNATYFDLRNIHSQCYRCNINLGGNGAEYYPYMLDKYGIEVINELRELSRTTKKITIPEYEDMIKDMEQKLKDLECGE